MAEKNDNKKTSGSSNDISEMLRLLRESFDNDKRIDNDSSKEMNEDFSVRDDEIKASLEKIFEEASIDKDSATVDEDDVFEDEEEESSWFALGEDDKDDNIGYIVDDEPAEEPEEESAEEKSVEEAVEEEDPDNDDPWYTDDEPAEEPEEESAEEESVEESVEEEDPDNDDPWYTDEEPVEETGEESEEESVEEAVEEEDPDNDDPWYTDEEPAEETEEESVDEEPIEEVISAEETACEEINSSENSEWYVVTTETEEKEEILDSVEEEKISIDDESVWYNAEEKDESDKTEEDEVYQDEEFDDDDNGYDEDFEEDNNSEEPIDKSPENDYAERDLYIFDAEKTDEDDYLYDTRPKNAEGEEATEEPDEKTIDETDMSLLSDLGVSVDANEVDSTDKKASADGYAGDIAYDYDGGEYVLENQRNEISAGYRNEKRRTLARLIACGSVALVLFIYEMLSAAGVSMPGMLDPIDFPLSHIMISLQCLIMCTLMFAKQLYIGIVDLINRKPTPYSVSSVIVLANTVYSIVISIALPEQLGIFNFVGAFSIVMAIAYEFLLLISEEHVFSVFSTKKGQKYAFISDGTSEETAGDKDLSLCAYSTDFNKNYFLRMRKRAEDYKYLTYVIFAVLGLSAVMFIISLICQTGLSLAMKNGVMIVNFALPIGVLGAFSYPVFRASVKALGGRGAFVGASAVDEYSKTRFVTFGEEELFTSLKTTHLDLKPSGNSNVSEVLCKTGVLLSAVGGPMKRMVEAMQSDFVGSSVEIDEIFDDGISAWADGIMMLAGSAQFLLQHGVKVDEKTDFKDVDDTNEVLYISIDGKLAARYYLKYKADAEFIKLVNALGARGISVGVRTRNPAINSDIIARRCKGLKYKIYTIKAPAKDEGEQNLTRSTTDSGLVSAGKASSLVYPLLACCDLKKYYKIDMIIRIISAGAGAALVIANAIAEESAGLSILSAMLYQLIWMIPSLLFGIFHFKHRSKKKKFKIVK